jgi:hypothetical protein
MILKNEIADFVCNWKWNNTWNWENVTVPKRHSPEFWENVTVPKRHSPETSQSQNVTVPKRHSPKTSQSRNVTVPNVTT